MTTDENTRPLAALFAEPVATAESVGDARPRSTPRRSRHRLRLPAEAPPRVSHRSRWLAAAAFAIVLLVGLAAAGRAPRGIPEPVARPSQSTPTSRPARRTSQQARPVSRGRGARAPKRGRTRRRHRRHSRSAVRRPPVPLVTPAPASPPAVRVGPMPSWRPSPAPAASGEPEFF